MTTPTDKNRRARWVGWVRASRQPDWLHTLDAMLDNPQKYGARLHWAIAGGHGGSSGIAACGVAVPADDADEIKLWVSAADQQVPQCKKCKAKVNHP